jgi:hypothetical protein
MYGIFLSTLLLITHANLVALGIGDDVALPLSILVQIAAFMPTLVLVLSYVPQEWRMSCL